MNKLLLAALAAVALASCAAEADLKSANAAIDRFHTQLNAGKLNEIYTESDKQMKDGSTQRDMEQLLSAVRRKLGSYKSGKQVGWNVNATTSGTFTTVAWQTQFERGTASEQFVFRSRDGKSALVGYNINSNALIVN